MNSAGSLVAAAAGVVLATSACGIPTQGGAATVSPVAPAALNGRSAADIVAAINSAGLPTPNSRDVTSQKCGKLQCIGAIDSDTVSVLKFDHSGPAQLYAGAISNSYQVENIVAVFASTVTAAQKAAYERAVERAAE